MHNTYLLLRRSRDYYTTSSKTSSRARLILTRPSYLTSIIVPPSRCDGNILYTSRKLIVHLG